MIIAVCCNLEHSIFYCNLFSFSAKFFFNSFSPGNFCNFFKLVIIKIIKKVMSDEALMLFMSAVLVDHRIPGPPRERTDWEGRCRSHALGCMAHRDKRSDLLLVAGAHERKG